MKLQEIVANRCGKEISQCTNEELYYALLEMTKGMAEEKVSNQGKRKLYYISAEFLIGKLLSNNLINLGIYEDVKKLLADNGKSLAEIEEVEPEPSLGNGGLGRLAACFLDSIASLGLNGDGVGLNYHYGLFKQVFKNNLQNETPNPWIEKESWLTKTDVTYPIQFGGFTLQSRLYDIDVIGYENRTTKLHLFDVETVDESLVGEGIDFDKEDIAKNLTLFLYPDDSDDKGRILRVYQQYFMVSNAAQLIIDETLARGGDLHKLNEYAAIQINDTHPSMVIPELIRLLMQRGILMDEAIEIVSKTCAYTNHTILAEALEKWPIELFSRLLPRIYQITKEIDNRLRSFVWQATNNADQVERMAVVSNGVIRMANLCVASSHSVNGVSALHSEILKETVFHDFYVLTPDKFKNVTNGIAHRRWLCQSNPELTALLTELIGGGFVYDANELLKLREFKDDEKILEKLREIKTHNKEHFAALVKKNTGIELDPTSIFDVQVKRLHEYKRQHLNALNILADYLMIKANPSIDYTPHTYIFGAKAAAGYYMAKKIISFIYALGEMINNDPDVNGRLKVVYIEDYNVTMAEKLMPAADISEQISLAGTEASGTGNMKLMLNGAITLGTMDGANIEIHDAVGSDNIFIFGMKTPEVNELKRRGYNPMNYYNNNQELHNVIDFIAKNDIAGKRFPEIANIINNDPYMVLADFADYRRMQQYAVSVWADKKKWQQMSLMNISGAGIFSADRAIHEYADNIWHTKSAFNGETYPAGEPAKVKKEAAEQITEKKVAEAKAPEKKAEKKPAEKKAAAKTAASAGKKAKKKKK